MSRRGRWASSRSGQLVVCVRSSGSIRTVFRGFDAAKVAAMTGRDVDRLVRDASIIRNRPRSGDDRQCTRVADRVAEPRSAAKSYEITRNAHRDLSPISRLDTTVRLVRQTVEGSGYRFVGPTSVYAFMQNVGVVTTTSTVLSRLWTIARK